MSPPIASAITDHRGNIAARRALCDALLAAGWSGYPDAGAPDPEYIHLGNGDYVCAVARDASVDVLHMPSSVWARTATVATIHRPRTRTWRAQMVRDVGAVVAAHKGVS